MTSRIVLLHATPVAMEPIHTAFAEIWPQAETINLLDDGLSVDRARSPELTEAMIARFVRLGEYAADMQADGILITCSAFGPAIDRLAAALSIPVLRPNEAMFRQAIARGSHIGMLATFGPAVETMTAEFDEYVARTGSTARLTTVLVPEAIDLLKKGDAQSHNRLVAERAGELAHCDVIMLAHFSTSRAAAAVREQVTIPVLTAPHAAASLMKTSVTGTEKE
nr:aspartate/glutamate racemase family protein [uncultured Erwinia sp.]